MEPIAYLRGNIDISLDSHLVSFHLIAPVVLLCSFLLPYPLKEQ